MATVSQIRQTFLTYFKNQGHCIVPASPLVPANDPTLLFTNAGMNQFKDYFTGVQRAPYATAASCQKCVRAGGKHNDLDNVGYTARHHTFFEMLGNFSFGDYFKEQAIIHAWTLLTQELRIAPEKLLVTVYHSDHQARDLWKKIAGLGDDKIISIHTNDNFWSMGDTGPCGPCSEIFYDHGDHIAGGPPGSPDQDGDRFVEIWNLVFMQYNQQQGGQQVSLPQPSIDTGAGLERLATVLQGVHNNYDTDLFQQLIKQSQNLTTDDPSTISSHRVIADHLRASCFVMADGVMPSNEGRGYVLRRIMRRAMRHAYILGAQDPLMHRLVPGLITEMGEFYPELVRAQVMITENLRLEEERFRETLGRGLKLLNDEIETLQPGASFTGDSAFKLYDTYGFPLDLTQDILREKNITVDTVGFDAAMAIQKQMARAAWQGDVKNDNQAIWGDIASQGITTTFLGYDQDQSTAIVTALVCDNRIVSELKAGDVGWLMVDQTPFYSEAGGQVGDQGHGVTGDQNCQFTVLDVQRKAGQITAHHVEINQGSLQVNQPINLIVNHGRRDTIRANHSATHLLHAILRKVLGDHVTQKGSLVNAEKLRFDFSHSQALTPAQRHQIEQDVNTMIRANYPVVTENLTLDAARSKGAMALFGEKYGDMVRVITMKSDRDHSAVGSEQSLSQPLDQSIEFCGGTHVKRTGDIGLFKIVSETGMAAGIRRIEAITGAVAEQYVHDLETQHHEFATWLKCHDNQVPAKLKSLVDDLKKSTQEVRTLKQKIKDLSPVDYTVQIVNDIQFVTCIFTDINMGELRHQVDQAKAQYPQSAIIAFGSTIAGKASLVIAVTPNLLSRYNAVDLVKQAVPILGGSGGGGRPDLAQAGGPNADRLMDAINKINF